MTTDSAAIAKPASGKPADSADVSSFMSHKQILVVFGSLMLGLLLAALDQTIVSTAMLTIVGDIGGKNGLAHMPWIATAYVLASTASTPIYGKLSDQFGRKPLYMSAIVLFLIGSGLSGFALNLPELIGFRALQGLGAGGIMGLTFAIVGDVVPPRERGRYQGLFGGVFMLSMVAGPLLGGFFTDHATILGVTGWRWVFYVNLPIGIIALATISSVLHLPKRRVPSTIDFLGAALVVAGVCSLLLMAQLGGQEYAWSSPTIIGLGVAGVLLLVAFVWWELRRAAEPILPMHLFNNPVFRVSNIMGFLLGMVMMGSMMYLPIFFQIVNGDSPTDAGLRMLPMMAGVLITSIGSGRIISKTNSYRKFPIGGLAVASIGIGLMATVTEHTNGMVVAGYMFLLGLGMGAVMQVLILAVQNSVEMRDMGVATTSATFFRSMGQAFGMAIMGAVLTGQLTSRLKPLAASNPQLAHSGGGMAILQNRAAMAAMPANVKEPLIHAFTQSLSAVFVVAAGLALVGFAVSFFLKETKLRGAAPDEVKAREAEAAPAMAH